MSHDPSHGQIQWIKMDDLAQAIYAAAWKWQVEAIRWFLSGLDPEALPDFHSDRLLGVCWFLNDVVPEYWVFLDRTRALFIKEMGEARASGLLTGYDRVFSLALLP